MRRSYLPMSNPLSCDAAHGGIHRMKGSLLRSENSTLLVIRELMIFLRSLHIPSHTVSQCRRE